MKLNRPYRYKRRLRDIVNFTLYELYLTKIAFMSADSLVYKIFLFSLLKRYLILLYMGLT